jgi:hypothetical protein
VQAYIVAMPAWKRQVGRQFHNLVVATIPNISKVVRWNTVFYGMENNGWAISVHCFNRYVKISLLNGGSLDPLPPEASTYPAVRSLHVYEKNP